MVSSYLLKISWAPGGTLRGQEPTQQSLLRWDKQCCKKQTKKAKNSASTLSNNEKRPSNLQNHNFSWVYQRAEFSGQPNYNKLYQEETKHMNYYLERTQEKEAATIEMGENKILKAKCELEVGVVSLCNNYEPQKGEFTFTQKLFSTGLQRVLRKMRGQTGGQREPPLVPQACRR